jgi:hypothetical protein
LQCSDLQVLKPVPVGIVRNPQEASMIKGGMPMARWATNGIQMAGDDTNSLLPQQMHAVTVAPMSSFCSHFNLPHNCSLLLSVQLG